MWKSPSRMSLAFDMFTTCSCCHQGPFCVCSFLIRPGLMSLVRVVCHCRNILQFSRILDSDEKGPVVVVCVFLVLVSSAVRTRAPNSGGGEWSKAFRCVEINERLNVTGRDLAVLSSPGGCGRLNHSISKGRGRGVNGYSANLFILFAKSRFDPLLFKSKKIPVPCPTSSRVSWCVPAFCHSWPTENNAIR